MCIRLLGSDSWPGRRKPIRSAAGRTRGVLRAMLNVNARRRIFSPLNLGDLSADRHETCSLATQVYKIGSEIWMVPPPQKKNGGPKRQIFGAISDNFST